MSDNTSLEEYKEMYLDMQNTANYFIKEGKRLNHSGLIDAAKCALSLCKEGILINDLLEAEANYNEIAGELFDCNEFYDELNE